MDGLSERRELSSTPSTTLATCGQLDLDPFVPKRWFLNDADAVVRTGSTLLGIKDA